MKFTTAFLAVLALPAAFVLASADAQELATPPDFGPAKRDHGDLPVGAHDARPVQPRPNVCDDKCDGFFLAHFEACKGEEDCVVKARKETCMQDYSCSTTCGFTAEGCANPAGWQPSEVGTTTTSCSKQIIATRITTLTSTIPRLTLGSLGKGGLIAAELPTTTDGIPVASSASHNHAAMTTASDDNITFDTSPLGSAVVSAIFPDLQTLVTTPSAAAAAIESYQAAKSSASAWVSSWVADANSKHADLTSKWATATAALADAASSVSSASDALHAHHGAASDTNVPALAFAGVLLAALLL